MAAGGRAAENGAWHLFWEKGARHPFWHPFFSSAFGLNFFIMEGLTEIDMAIRLGMSFLAGAIIGI
ncbi:MAG: hypothetical protein LBU28_04920, partial [Spirochaetaceae bacterium]|nr:hypothetical protein [Spirochaetaceae bacterium]